MGEWSWNTANSCRRKVSAELRVATKGTKDTKPNPNGSAFVPFAPFVINPDRSDARTRA